MFDTQELVLFRDGNTIIARPDLDKNLFTSDWSFTLKLGVCPSNNSLSPTFSPYLSSLIHRRPVKQCYFLFTYTFLAFFVAFHQKICVFIYLFIYFFIDLFIFLLIYLFIHSFIYWFIYLWNINFPQENIDELETGIGDRKLSVELCGGLILFLVFCIIFVDEICQHLGKSFFTAILQIL